MILTLSDIIIRPFVPSDIPIVLEKHKVLYAKEFGYLPDAFSTYVSDALDDFLERKGGMLWIAEYPKASAAKDLSDDVEQSIWAGCIAIVRIGNGIGRLRFLLVDFPFRSCGLGRKMMEVALGYCEDMNYKRIVLSTAGDCQSAIRMYKKFGFRMVKSSEGTVWGGLTDEWWEKVSSNDGESEEVASLNVGPSQSTIIIVHSDAKLAVFWQACMLNNKRYLGK